MQDNVSIHLFSSLSSCCSTECGGLLPHHVADVNEGSNDRDGLLIDVCPFAHLIIFDRYSALSPSFAHFSLEYMDT